MEKSILKLAKEKRKKKTKEKSKAVKLLSETGKDLNSILAIAKRKEKNKKQYK